MDPEDTMDFQALRAKFQDEELLQKQPKIKPVPPEKPKVVPPPQSPTHYLPAGARPSLLAAINQNLEGKAAVIPRVVFKDDKAESKMPLIRANSKGKDKSEGKLKASKDKTTKASKVKNNDASSDQKQKKESGKDKRWSLTLPAAHKASTAELVPATPPPKSTTLKKGFLGLKKSKKEQVDVTADPILDVPSSDIAGPAPLIPVPSDFDDAPLPQPEISAPKVPPLNIPSLADSDTMEITSLSIIPDLPNFSPPPDFIPDNPVLKVETPRSETLELDTPALPVSISPSQNDFFCSPASNVSTPPSSRTTASPLPVASTPSSPPPEPQIAAEASIETIKIAAVATPSSPGENSPSSPPSFKAEHPLSALSALERAEDMSPGKRTPPGDQRIFSALEKLRNKSTSPLTVLSPLTNLTTSVTPPPEEYPPPSTSLPELPPIDYEDRAENAFTLKPEPLNGLDHPQASPLLEDVTKEGPDALPPLLMVDPPLPRKALQDSSSLDTQLEKPVRPPSVNLSELTPPHSSPEEDYLYSAKLPVSAVVPNADATDVPEFNVLATGAHSPELPVSERGNGKFTGSDIPDGQDLPENYNNGLSVPVPEVHSVSALGDEYQDNPTLAGSEAEAHNSIYESTENVYEDINTSATKKKGKTDGGKKRKGPPTNPYAEAAQETTEEKTKTGRFGKSDKKVTAEGPDEKELKKKEKQRLEKERRELKEKQEREKKEQKEREKKENEIKKKFKVTGHEEAMYNAKVTVTTKGRKNDLPVKEGDVISIIRTTNCPKGKWLARDSSNNYGYVAVDHVELDIKEMLELGKKTAGGSKTTCVVDGEVTNTRSRASNHYPQSAESFSDDSEEWTVDDDEALSPAHETTDLVAPMGHTRTFSMPDMGNNNLSINHQHSYSDSAEGPYNQARHEALQKLETFFQSPKPAEPAACTIGKTHYGHITSGLFLEEAVNLSTARETSPVLEEAVNLSTATETSPVLEEAVNLSTATETSHVLDEAVNLPDDNSTKELDFDHPEMLILPPPEMYA